MRIGAREGGEWRRDTRRRQGLDESHDLEEKQERERERERERARARERASERERNRVSV